MEEKQPVQPVQPVFDDAELAYISYILLRNEGKNEISDKIHKYFEKKEQK